MRGLTESSPPPPPHCCAITAEASFQPNALFTHELRVVVVASLSPSSSSPCFLHDDHLKLRLYLLLRAPISGKAWRAKPWFLSFLHLRRCGARCAAAAAFFERPLVQKVESHDSFYQRRSRRVIERKVLFFFLLLLLLG